MPEFKCSFCGRKTTSEDFPYEKGWKYLYSFKWKDSNDLQLQFKDSHFCSSSCLTAFIVAFFEKKYGRKK
jgi:hypothetical protein